MAAQALDTKLAEAIASDSPTIKDGIDLEKRTKNVQGRTEVTLIPRPSDNPRDPLVCKAWLMFNHAWHFPLL